MFVVTGRDWGRDFRRRIAQESFIVHSVFKTVCNLQSMPERPLLAFVTRASARGPNTLWVPGADFSSLRVGEEVLWGDGKLCCGELAIVFGERAALWSCDERQMGEDDFILESTFEANLKVASENCLEAVEGWFELQFPGLCSNYSEQVCQLCAGLKTGNLLKTRNSLLNLIGSGEGLTPSGDDFVAGVLLGYVRSQRNCEDQFLNALPELVRDLAGRTNEISSTMLWYAARGEGAMYLTGTADQILSAGPFALQHASELTKVGSSSGKYLLAGLLRGIKLKWDTRDGSR